MMLSLSRVKPTMVITNRLISTTNPRSYAYDPNEILDKAKGRKPWDKRFPVNPRDVAPTKKGGSKKMLKILPEKLVAPVGIIDKQTKKMIPVPEMVPEFIVPDLTDFKLKAYVSYSAKDIKQNELTPRDIFNSLYAEDVKKGIQSGTIKVKDGKVHLEDGNILDLASGKRVT